MKKFKSKISYTCIVIIILGMAYLYQHKEINHISLTDPIVKEVDNKPVEQNSGETNGNSKNAESAATEEKLIDSKIPKPYTLKQSQDNGDIIYMATDYKYLNNERLKEFLNNVENNKEDRIRYSQYCGELLDKMRDVEFKGNKFIVKEYDTKSPEIPTYFYLTFEGDSLIKESGYYRLKSNDMKLFPLN